jgi:tetratricopeptide (TPR) repeat protein
MRKTIQIFIISLLPGISQVSPAWAAQNLTAEITVKQNNKEFDALILRARTEAFAGNFSISLKYLLDTMEKATEKKDFTEAEALARYIYISTDNLDYLNAYYQKLEKRVNENISSPAFELLIKSYEEIRNYEGIINLYRLKLLTANKQLTEPEKAMMFEKMGDLYEQLNQFQLSSDNYKRALEFNDKNQGAREHIAFNLLLSGDIRGSEMHYKKLAEINPDNDNAHLGLGIITYIKGDAKNAAEEFKLVKKKDINSTLMELITKYELAKGPISNMFRYWGI